MTGNQRTTVIRDAAWIAAWGRERAPVPARRGRCVHRRPHRPRRGALRRPRRAHHRRLAAVRHAGARQPPLPPPYRARGQGRARGPRGPGDVRHRALRALLRVLPRRAGARGGDGDGLRGAPPLRGHHRRGPLQPHRRLARPGGPERPPGLRRLVLRRRVLEAREPARARVRLGRGARAARVRRLPPGHGPRRAAPERAASRYRLSGPDRDLHRVDPPRRRRPRARDRPPPHHPPLAVEARVPGDRAPPRQDPARIRGGHRLPRPGHDPGARHLHRRAPRRPLADDRRPRPPRRLRDHRRPLPLPLRPPTGTRWPTSAATGRAGSTWGWAPTSPPTTSWRRCASPSSSRG